MEQRSLRLGDVVDDYCPCERRVTNHVIVVLDADAIRQTRCNTCDAEHEYKEAKVPRRKKGETSDLAGGVLVTSKSTNGNGAATDVPASAVAAASAAPAPAPALVAAEAPAPVAAQSAQDAKADDNAPADGWLAHRPLIRASLPRTEGDAPPTPRPIPEFTMHQRQGRGFGGRGGFRHGNPSHNGGRMPSFRDGNGEPDGNRPPAPGGGAGGGKGRHRRRRRR